MYEKFKRSEWFRKDRFGMFIHWGLYAIPARGEWVRGKEKIPDDKYMQYFNEFTAEHYDPVEWARAAKRAGMKYAVMTAKHHDGFCLFDSAHTDFKATNTPAGRDFAREFLDAFRAEGMRAGLYYSLIDWNHPAYPAYGHAFHPMKDNPEYAGRPPFDQYLDYMHAQVEELCTNYGKLDLLWFDFSYEGMTGESWRATDLVNLIRKHQPDALLNNRLDGIVFKDPHGSIRSANPKVYAGDLASVEQIIPPGGVKNELGEPIPWETIVTLNDNWGYHAGDFNYKNRDMVVKKLIECVSKDGNMLLNVGPDGKGRIPDMSLDILAEVGGWMQKHGGSIYGCGGSGLDKPEWGRYTRRGDILYAHVTEPPVGELALYGLRFDQIESARLLSDGSELAVVGDWTCNFPDVPMVKIGPLAKYDSADTVLRIALKV